MDEQYVNWKTFKIIIAITMAIFGILLTIQISLMTNVSEIKSDISAIRTDVVWIKDALHEDVAIK